MRLKSIQAAKEPEVRFRWVPAYSIVIGDKKANLLANLAMTRQIATPPAHIRAISHALSEIKRLGQGHWTRTYATTEGGRHTRDLDKALPGTHRKTLYDCLTRSRVTTLAHMRAGECGLKYYLYAIEAEDWDLCECGQKETEKDVVLDCSKWTVERQELRAAVRDRDR